VYPCARSARYQANVCW